MFQMSKLYFFTITAKLYQMRPSETSEHSNIPKRFYQNRISVHFGRVPLFAVFSLVHPIFIWVSNFSRTFYFINSVLMRNVV